MTGAMGGAETAKAGAVCEAVKRTPTLFRCHNRPPPACVRAVVANKGVGAATIVATASLQRSRRQGRQKHRHLNLLPNPALRADGDKRHASR